MKLYFRRLNYLRGVCAVCIVISHWSMYFNAKIFSFGLALTSAIYAFFILSGVTIVYFHNNDGKSMCDMLKFLKKRFLRIFPVYWIYIAITLFLNYAFDGKVLTWHTKTYKDILKSVCCFPAAVFENHPTTLIPPAWFLSYVVLFYLVYAILRYMFGNNGFKLGERIWIVLIFVLNGGVLLATHGLDSYLI